MSKIDKAVQWAINIAQDNTHGYSQAHRYGPDYDCSSMVIEAWQQAGIYDSIRPFFVIVEYTKTTD